MSDFAHVYETPPPGAAEDWTIPQDWAAYTQVEHDTWNTLYARQIKILPGRASDQFMHGLEAPPDVVVTDMTMPDIDGRELASRISERSEHTVFVFMSGYTESTTFWEEVPRNRSAFIQKPFSEDALSRVVEAALGSEGDSDSTS